MFFDELKTIIENNNYIEKSKKLFWKAMKNYQEEEKDEFNKKFKEYDFCRKIFCVLEQKTNYNG